MNYSYFPGCTLKTRGAQLDKAGRLAAENIPYCDEFADGVVETIAKADGMLWNREGKSVWLFAGATLLKGAVIPQQADTTVVIAMQGDDKWIDELKAALQ